MRSVLLVLNSTIVLSLISQGIGMQEIFIMYCMIEPKLIIKPIRHLIKLNTKQTKMNAHSSLT
jgi:hypothetical protein